MKVRRRSVKRRHLPASATRGPEPLERRACPAVVSVAAPATVDEAAGQTELRVTLSETVATTTTVNYTFLNGTRSAVFGSDYSVSLDGRQLGSAGVLTFRPGQTSLALLVKVANDGQAEQVETFTMTLFSPRGLTLGGRQATVSINDAGAGTPGGGGTNNPSLPLVSIRGPGTVAEPMGQSTMVVGLSQPATRAVTVGYTMTPLRTNSLSPATYGLDYAVALAGRRLLPTGTLTFLPGQTSLTLDLAVLNDVSRERDEAFTFSLQRPVGAAFDSSATAAAVTIRDDDNYTVSIVGPSSIAAGQPYDFLVELSSPATQREIFYATTVDGTATASQDYHPLYRSPVIIQAGQTTGRLRINTLADNPANPEYDESFSIRLEALSRGFPAPSPNFTTTIAGPLGPRPPNLSISDASVVEGAAGSTTDAVFTVTLAAPWSRPVTVSYVTADGSAAVSDADYRDSMGSVTFAPGETVQTVRIPVVGDSRAEPDETFTVALSNPVNAILSRATGTATVTNDDGDPVPEYRIVVVFPDNSLTAAQQAVFQAAAARWSEIIVADMPDVTYQGRTIDDLEIAASAPAIDGAGGVLGQAGPERVRMDGTFLPYLGVMEFDSADVAGMVANGTFEDVILHEMGHVIGVGTLWDQLGLVNGLGTTNPTFVGTNAVREYQTLSGTQATSVPVENTGGPGTAGGHWRESVFGMELMTGYAEPAGTSMPISRLTVASLQDIGYTVDYAAADPFTLNARQAAANFRQLQLQGARNRASQRFMLTAGDDRAATLFAAAASRVPDVHGQTEFGQTKPNRFRSLAGRPA